MSDHSQKKGILTSSELLTEYLTFLQDHQCVAPTTIGARRNYVTVFLAALKERGTPSKICGLTASTIHDYIIETTESLRRGCRKQIVSAIISSNLAAFNK